MIECCKIMNTVIQNILKNPLEEKFCKLRLANPSIKKNVADIQQAKFLLEMIGFEEMLLIPDTKPGQPLITIAEPFLVLTRDRADPRDMQHLSSIMLDIVTKNNLTPLTNKIEMNPLMRDSLEEKKRPVQNSI